MFIFLLWQRGQIRLERWRIANRRHLNLEIRYFAAEWPCVFIHYSIPLSMFTFSIKYKQLVCFDLICCSNINSSLFIWFVYSYSSEFLHLHRENLTTVKALEKKPWWKWVNPAGTKPQQTRQHKTTTNLNKLVSISDCDGRDHIIASIVAHFVHMILLWLGQGYIMTSIILCGM